MPRIVFIIEIKKNEEVFFNEANYYIAFIQRQIYLNRLSFISSSLLHRYISQDNDEGGWTICFLAGRCLYGGNTVREDRWSPHEEVQRQLVVG